MKKKGIWRVSALALTVSMSCGMAAMPAVPLLAADSQETSLVSGSVSRAPKSADLVQNGNLDWVHCCDKDQSAWPGSGTHQIRDITLSGTLAQIMSDTDTNFIYPGSPSDNHKGQVLNRLGSKTTFTLPASLETRYVSVFTGSWASKISLKVFINDEEQYSNTHGKNGTSSGAESFLTQFSYHTQSEQDVVRVEIETIEVYDTTYGNHSIQAIALSDVPQNYEMPSAGSCESRISQAPALVNLSRQGQSDWVRFDQKDLGALNHKNTESASIRDLTLIGDTDYVTKNSPSAYVYADGLSPMIQESEDHSALVFTGQNKGFSFKVPGGSETKMLNIYAGAWAADIEVSLSVDGAVIHTETFGSTDTTAGSPARYGVIELDYATDTEEDDVQVSVRTSKVYDAQYGNMNIAAVTLGGERLEESGHLAGMQAKAAPASCVLDEEGALDWFYLNNRVFADYARKDLETPLLDNLTILGQLQSDPITSKTKTGFSYTEGVPAGPIEDEHLATVFLHQGSGLEFTMPASKTMKYLTLYAGAWAADVRVELEVNGKVEQTLRFGSSSTVNDSTSYQAVRLAYKTASDHDSVKVRAVVEKVYSAQWGNMNISAVTLSDLPWSSAKETIRTEHWTVNHTGGEISSLECMMGGEMYNIPMRSDSKGGFAWTINGRKVALSSISEDENGLSVYTGRYRENGKDVTVSLSYSVNEEDALQIHAVMSNNQDQAVSVDKASLQIGFNTYLEKYPDYNDQLFPTLIRCEKTHAWGYFSTPSGRLMSLAVDAPTASYTLDYQSGQHRIYTASLDLLQKGPVPERHPQNLDHLEAKETKEWNVTLKPVAELDRPDLIKETIADSTSLPMLDADRYTIEKEEVSHITIDSRCPLEGGIRVTNPDGTTATLQAAQKEDGLWHAEFAAAGKEPGVYALDVTNTDGYVSQMMISVRNDWSWYIQKARQAAVEAPQKASSHGETFYGFYSAYIAKKYFPDEKWDRAIDEKFEEVYPLMYNTATGLPTSWENRIQNHSTTLGIFVDMYQSSGNEQALEQAEVLADFLMSKQHADGGYYNGGTDYTSVIYPAKSIMELAKVEKERAGDERLSEEVRAYNQERYALHMDSLTKAMDKLVRVDGNFDTEGQGTFEDGANSCSITQLSEFALMFEEGSAQRRKYTEAAVKYMNRHTSHQQSIIPDSRMNGGTLRFWEAQYDVEMGLTSGAPNMMNSPHGWSGWNIYGLFNLYELTGNTDYLIRGMNAMGSCAQLMGFDGTLRWAFVADPVRQTRLFVKDEEKSQGDTIVGKHVTETIGEQYVDMISYWWKAPANTWVPGYTAMGGSITQGACCDNDVHEIFKAMGEVALTKAYVFEDEDGSLQAYNCTAAREDGKVVITPAEEVVSNISVQLKTDADVRVHFYNGDMDAHIGAGLPVWVSTAENAQDTSTLDKNAELAGLRLQGGSADHAFDAQRTEYTIRMPEEGGSLVITPQAASDKASVYVNGEYVPAGESYTYRMDAPKDLRDVRVVVKSERQAASKTYVLHLSTMGDNVLVPVSAMTARAGSEQGGNSQEGPARFVLDDNTSTLWHTQWSPSTVAMSERWIEFDLEEAILISGLRYQPRQSGQNGNITGWQVWISPDDSDNWTTVSQGSWDNNTAWKTASFDAIRAKRVRLVPTQTYGNYASAAEIRLLRKEDAKEEANKTLLAMAVSKAQALEADGALNGVNELVVDAFHQALEEASACLQDGSASQQRVNEVWLQLSKVIQMLSFKTDKSELKALIDECQTLADGADDTLVQKEALLEALENAKAVLENPAVLTDQSIAAAITALNQAKADLLAVLRLDTQMLEWLLAQANDLDESLYLSQTLVALHASMEQAQAALGAASQQAVDAALESLHQAWLGLRLKADEALLARLAALNSQLKALDLSAMDASLRARIEQASDVADALLAAPEADKEEVQNLITQTQSLLNAADADAVASKLSANPASGTRSVRTAASSHASTSIAASLLALGGLLAAWRRRHK